MKTIFRPILVVALLLGSAWAAHAADRAAVDQQATVDHAVATLQDLRKGKEFGNARELLQTARAVIIAPRVYRAGFIGGGQGGHAVLLVREQHGWSSPAFYSLGSASFGLQIGADESEMVMFIMTDKALRALMRNKLELGANASLAFATLGSTAEQGTTTAGLADIVVWASSSGVFAGVSLQGTVISAALNDDRSYYGHRVTSYGIVFRHDAYNPHTRDLMRTLESL